MESIIKKVPQEDCVDLATILVHAYPGPSGITEESIHKAAQNLRNDPDAETHTPFYGAYREGKLLGALKLHEFTMSLRGAKIRVGGIAGVCVHFLHKKEKVSRDLIAFALEYYHSQGINITSLYPFQTGFYKNMGFGYGAMKHQYRIRPDAFPKGASKRKVEHLTSEDKPDLLACYQQYVQTKTGMFERQEIHFNEMFHAGNTVVGVKQEGKLTGYLNFRFQRVKAEYPQKFDLAILEFVYHTPEALSELCTFLHSQSDQVNQVILNSQEEDFHYLFHNPTNGSFDSFNTTALECSVTAVGAMYRVLDLKDLLSKLTACDFGAITCKLKINVEDNFFKSSSSSIVIHFNNGTITDLRDDAEFEVSLSLDIANLSSLLIGAVGFSSLVTYGLATLSDPTYLITIHRLFAADHKPMNQSNF